MAPISVVVLGNGSRDEVENTKAHRSEVVSIAEKIREYRARFADEIPTRQSVWKCRM